jgi:hypothetical protein
VQEMLSARHNIPDPLQSFFNRHLERDVSTCSSRHVSQTRCDAFWRRRTNVSSSLHMIWPRWEQGHVDFIEAALIPLGYLLHCHQRCSATATTPPCDNVMPASIAISGIRYPRIIEPILRTRPLCTSEREAEGIPRCAPACYHVVHICKPRLFVGFHAYASMATLDSALGFPIPNMSRPPPHAAAQGHLRVLFARRHGRRFILNTDALVERCDGTRIRGLILSCGAANLGKMPLVEMVTLLRQTDVFISMYGGDVINGIHMLPGRLVIELVNNGFELQAHHSHDWLDQSKRLLSPVIEFRRVVLPPLAHQQQRNQSFHEAWNGNALVPWPLIRLELRAFVDGASLLTADQRQAHLIRQRQQGEVLRRRSNC